MAEVAGRVAQFLVVRRHYTIMKILIITGVTAVFALLTGCGKSSSSTTGVVASPTFTAVDAALKSEVDLSPIIVYAKTDTNSLPDIRFDVSEVWKGSAMLRRRDVTLAHRFHTNGLQNMELYQMALFFSIAGVRPLRGRLSVGHFIQFERDTSAARTR